MSHTPDQLYTMLLNGMSVQEIAARVGKTKNSVTGLIYRYRKQNGIEPIHKAKSPKYPEIKQDIPIRTKRRRDKLPPAKVDKFLQVIEHNLCRYISGDIRGEHSFCTEKAGRRGYCEEHYKRCYVRSVK